jgi:hypothetical protein
MSTVQTVIRDREERLGEVGASSFQDSSRGGSGQQSGREWAAVGEGVDSSRGGSGQQSGREWTTVNTYLRQKVLQ